MPSFSAEERQLLHESLNDYLSSAYTFEHFRRLTKGEGEGFDRAAWKSYAELGWLGVAIPEALGGAGGGVTELGIVMAAAGRHLVLEPLLATIALGATAIRIAGRPDQQGLLQKVADGSLLLAFCHAEPRGGFARDYVRSTARRDGGRYVIDGEKTFALSAHAADQLIVSARIGGGEGPIRLFLVPRDAGGVTCTNAPALDGRPGAALRLSGVSVDGAALLGAPDAVSAQIDIVHDWGIAAVCAEAAGAMAAVTEQTIAYLKTRQQFGQALSKFQVLQHRLVDMSVAAEEARAATHAALQALDEGAADAGRIVAMAKVQTARSARFVGAQAIQLHGGMGMTDELAIGHYYKRLSFGEAQFGDAEWHLKELAKALPL
ncbi:MAG TPA: acyl-CoA dehydrogenase family protein [Hyphomicrobiaceae bacterium]|nr:acyl-CoA dehydrogenase family protein [Hyphomicrobiaceae bacterium]